MVKRLVRFSVNLLTIACLASCGRASRSPHVYVTNETSGDLSIVDAVSQSVVATVTLGKRPRGLTISPDGSALYVALSGSPAAPPGVDERTLPPPDKTADGIGVVDLNLRRLVRMLPGGSDPEQVAVSHDGKQVFVANEDAAALSVVDIASGRIVDSVKVGGEPEGVAVSPDDAVVYATSEAEGAVFVIDRAAHKLLKSFAVPPRPRAAAFLPDGARAYITSEN